MPDIDVEKSFLAWLEAITKAGATRPARQRRRRRDGRQGPAAGTDHTVSQAAEPPSPDVTGQGEANLTDHAGPQATESVPQPRRRTVKPREVLAAMRLAAGLSRIALDNQRVERLDKAAANNAFTLKDAVVPCMGLAHERLMAEVRRRGLEYAAELDMETSRALCDQAELDWPHTPEAKRYPPPPPKVVREPFAMPLIPRRLQDQIMARLSAMINPAGDEFATLSMRERLMAGKVWVLFRRLGHEQWKLNRLIQNVAKGVDEEKAWEGAEEEIRARLAECKREDEEIRRRREARQPQGATV
jgi:hypothetical protein